MPKPFDLQQALAESMQLLKDLELLMSINVPLTDGNQIHKAVVKFLERYEGDA